MAEPRADIEEIVRRHDKKWVGARGFAVAAILLLALAGSWLWWGASPSQGGPDYITETVAARDIIVLVTATGTVEPTKLVEISSELSGTIRSVEVDYNDRVEPGQVLARLDTDKLEATVEHGRAALAARYARVAEAQATLSEAHASYERSRRLEDRGITTTQTLQADKAALDRAGAALKSAEADVRVAEADLRMDEANLAKACICSPIHGVVLDRNVNVGQIVASALQAPVLFTLAEDLSRMELRVDIDEADIGKVKVGDTAVFTVEAYQDREFPAEIAELKFAPKTVDGVVTYEAILSIDNTGMLLRPGMTATAEIKVLEIADTLAVPNAALRYAPPVVQEPETGGGSGLLGMLFRNVPSRAPSRANLPDAGGHRTVWVLRGQEAVPVQILPGETDGSFTQVREGAIGAGDLVITDQTGS